MLNQVVVVGRLVRDPEVIKSTNNKNMSFVTLAIPRSFKNVHGEYETDFIDCTLWEGIAENTAEYCKKGDIIGVKGRLQSRISEKDDKKTYHMDLVAEKVTFLSSSSKQEEE